MNYIIREMTNDDHEELYSFWKSIEGLKMDESDYQDNFNSFLIRNPNLNYVVIHEKQIIGTIKCGHDGRRGYISHLAVNKKYQKYGIAKKLYNICIEELKKQSVLKCNLYILGSNKSAYTFWQHNGWKELEHDFIMLQKTLR
jgi:N-acetylglutamate synthase